MNIDAITAFHAFFSTDQVLKRIRSLRPLIKQFNAVPVGFVGDMSNLSEYLQKVPVQQFVDGLRARGSSCLNWHKVYLARVQCVLVELNRNQQMKTNLLKHFPELIELESLPAMGWLAYEELLNSSSGKCFENVSLKEDVASLDRSISRFDIFEDRIEGIYITNQRSGYYAERMSLLMPEQSPELFGEELVALDKVVIQALKMFRNCDIRGQDFYRKVPHTMIYQFHSDYPKAVKLSM